MHIPFPLVILVGASLFLWMLMVVIKNFSGGSVVKNFKKIGETYNANVDYSKKVGSAKYPAAYGSYRNRDIAIESYTNVEGKNSPNTLIKVKCDNLSNLTLSLKRKNKLSSGNNVPTGDSEFDDVFVMKTNDPEKAIQILDYTIKFKLLQTANLGYNGEILLEGNNISYSEPGLMKKESSLLRIELLLHVLSDIAEDLAHV